MSSRYLSRFLDTNGDGTGDKDAIGDYSATAETFFIQPPAGQVYEIHHLTVGIEDGTGFRAERYGSLAGPLTNGIHVRTADDAGEIIHLTDEHFIKSNAEWGLFAGASEVDLKSWGAGNELLLATWHFGEGGLSLVLGEGERLEVVLNDSFAGLVAHHFIIQGHRLR